MKKLRCLKKIIFMTLLCVGALFGIEAVNLKHTDSFYINDFANILNAETEDYIFNYSRTLDEKTSAQLVVVTVESLEGMNEAEYGLQILREWGIGNKEKNNGLLILLAPNERKVRIEVGDGLEGRINDSKAGRFLDEYAVPYFRDNNWDKGILSIYYKLLSEIYYEYNLDPPEKVTELVSSYSGENYESEQEASPIVLIVFFIFCTAIFVTILHRRKKQGVADWDNWYDAPPPYAGHNGDIDWTDFGGFGGGGGSSSGGGASRGF